ncbi:MAG: murein biosynthesis integral membrane protein MurJ [Coleofasciculaceae cyanobacterium SM2_1_6]|nr:murein biosynthesis integral membrane protein MurJ [Coleofasciculaceae cyanobacterium SM2_1_6]
MTEGKKSGKSFAGIAGIVAVATIISKIFGLFRQQAIAAAFGVGIVANSYGYAYVIPGFLLILLGGINGPFHSALVSILSKRSQEEAAPVVETVSTLVTAALFVVSILLVIFASPLIDLVAPGLGSTPAGAIERNLAIQQLQIMAPMAILAGLIGIGFGSLNAADQYWLPAVSPLLSSTAVIVGLGWMAWQLGDQVSAPEYAQLGGIVLAGTTLAGAVLQWLAQLWAQWRSGLGKLRLRFDWRIPGVKEAIAIMLPATFSSGMLQINVYTDLFFASFIPYAAAVLGYAGLLVNTPLGLVSNIILVPLMPLFSKLAAPENWSELKQRIRQGLLLTALTMLPISALMITLAFPVVRVVYERQAFDQQASALVAPVLVAYGIGMFAYLGRDVLVRVFYALEDGDTPFKISVLNIFLNALFDFIFVQIWGTVGIVLATVLVNVISMVMFLYLLNQKLQGLPLRSWSLPLLGITGASIVCGVVSWGINWQMQQIWGSEGLGLQLLEITCASLGGLLAFIFFVTKLNLPEVDVLGVRLREKLPW